MKKVIMYYFFILFVTSCTPSVQTNELIDNYFYSQFSDRNQEIRGTLFRYVFKNDLDTLTYNYYLKYMKGHPLESSKGIPEKIELADEHYFETKTNSFLIGLIYINERKVLLDDAITSKLDTIIFVKDNESFPSLRDLALKIWPKK